MDIEKEVEFFDRFEAEWGEYDVLAKPAYARILDVFARRLEPRPGMTCIDLGCGTGAFTRRLQRFELALTGVDISPRSIERARQLGGATFVVGDVCDSTAPAASYDFAVMSGILHHLPTADARVASLREARRLLKPGGRFFSYDPNGLSPSMFLYRDPRSPLYSSAGKTDNEILLTKAQLAGELGAAGFASVQVDGPERHRVPLRRGKLARRLLPLYNLVYENVMRLPIVEDVMGTFLIATATKPA